MPRLTELDDVMFQVEEHPVYASVRSEFGQQQVAIPRKKAIVDRNSGRVVGVVGRAYRLVSNRQALEMARTCCQLVFPETRPCEWDVQATDAPATGGHCSIDLLHNSTALDFAFVPAEDRPDVFGPFIRLSNSYNSARALAFDIGYYRKVCMNGMVAPQSVIRLRFKHSQNEIDEAFQFEIDHEKLAKLKSWFRDCLGVLRDCAVRRDQFVPLVSAVLSIHEPDDADSNRRVELDWNVLVGHLDAMSARYAAELGENAYAAFNAITEFASQPPVNRCIRRERHSLQRRAGAWLSEFTRACHEPAFNLGVYIESMNSPRANGAAAPAHPFGDEHD